MRIQMDDSILWAGKTSDICGLAIGNDGLVALNNAGVEGISLEGRSMWTVQLSSSPVRWGLALTGKKSVVTLSDGHVVCLTKDS